MVTKAGPGDVHARAKLILASLILVPAVVNLNLSVANFALAVSSAISAARR